MGLVCDDSVQQKQIGMGPYVASGEVATLYHEVWNDPMEAAAHVLAVLRSTST
jgi:hypothetical protein